MVKVKNANIGRGENFEEGGSSRGGRTGKGKRVATGRHQKDSSLSKRLLTLKNGHERKERSLQGRIQKQENITFIQWVISRVVGRDISFDDRLLNTILGIPENGIRFYTENKKCFDLNLYSERRFEKIFTKGEVLKRHNNRNVNKLDAYGRLVHHIISNIVIPNVSHKSSITNMHSFVMLALHEYRRMNFGYMAIEHMLATQISFTKCLPYGCFLTRVFQYFVLNLIGVGDPIGAGKSYNKHTFKRIRFAKNKEGIDEDDEGNKGQEAMNVDEEESEEELEEETYRREMRQKKKARTSRRRPIIRKHDSNYEYDNLFTCLHK
ncbi:hypothetical protein M9H77_22427 [Catharanthus roseus]|uniref:Uncharacterized protein n=1 Tax=Catharanthus roseus TaxID=4058 RepID=A0ACC0ASI5_CATRO|nr:hypothetical protein M9H77_22427 [Catharanthus roseus]